MSAAQPVGEMPGLAVGADLAAVERFEALVRRYGERFTARVFTGGEVADCAGRPESLAACWAAKEAAAKALGTGIGPVAPNEIEVVHDSARRPALRLHGRAQALAQQLGLTRWAVSLSHDGGLALAVVVALG